MVQLVLAKGETDLNARAVSSLVRHAITSLGDDPGSARQYLLNAESLLQPPKPPVRCEGLAPWQAKRVSAYIDAHLGDAVCLADLAQMARLSKGYFARGFKRTFGECFQTFLTRKRVERAQVLMSTTRIRLCEIACATGFADQSHFTRAFRGVTGATPGRWRRQTREMATQRVTVICPR